MGIEALFAGGHTGNLCVCGNPGRLHFVMNRRLISCFLLFAFALQGVSAANVSVGVGAGMSAHCTQMVAVNSSDDHSQLSQSQSDQSRSNDCCTDDCIVKNGCAVHCVFGIAPATVDLVHRQVSHEQQFVHWDTPSPNYIPLNPPPIL